MTSYPSLSPISSSPVVRVDGQIVEYDGREVALSRHQGRIVSHILSAKRGKTLNEIIDAVYFDDPNCGPLDAQNTIRVQICKIRKRIHQLGIDLKVYGGRYVVARLENEQGR